MAQLKVRVQMFAAALSPDQSCIVSGDCKYTETDCSVRITSLETGDELAVLANDLPDVRERFVRCLANARAWQIHSVAWSRDGKWIAASGTYNVVRVWQTPAHICKVRWFACACD